MVKVRKDSKTTPMLPAWKKSLTMKLYVKFKNTGVSFCLGVLDMTLRIINYSQTQKVSS